MEKYSLSDIGALLTNRNDGFLEGNGIIILILFFLIFGFGGGMFGGASGALTRAELYDGLNNQTVLNKLNGLENGLSSGFYAQNTTMLQGFSGIGSQIADGRYSMQNGFCETNRNIDAVRFENARNTCDIITAQNANTQRILDTLCQDRIQNLRDTIAEKDQMLQTANFQLSQQSQNAYLVSQLQPTPRPAYITCSPYQAQMYAWQNYGNGCGC